MSRVERDPERGRAAAAKLKALGATLMLTVAPSVALTTARLRSGTLRLGAPSNAAVSSDYDEQDRGELCRGGDHDE